MIPVAGDEKRLNSYINTNSRFGRRGDGDVAKVTRNDEIPLSNFTLQGKRLDRAFGRTMQADPNRADVLHSQPIGGQPDSITVRRKFDGIKEVSTLETRVSRFISRFDPTEEVLKCFVEPSHSRLSRREVDSGKVFVCAPFSLEPSRLLGIFDGLLFQLIGILLLSKTGIIQATMCLQHDTQLTLLVAIRPKPVFECLSQLFALLCFDVFSDRVFRDVPNRSGIVRSRPKRRQFRSQRGEFLSQNSGGISLQPIDNLSNSHRGVRGKKQVNVVRHDFDGFNVERKLGCFLVKQCRKPVGNLASEDFSSVFRAPHEMKLDIKDCSGVFGVSGCHTNQYIPAGYLCQGLFSVSRQKKGEAHSSAT